jgi:intracellular sulfur oxidation DsrE/DsrF family protein
MPNGMSKQAMAVKNLYDQYTALGMKPGKDYEIVMVFRADGAQVLLTDEAYDLKVKKPHPKGNPNKAMIEAMHKGGVKMYECHVAMKLKGYKPEDIFPFSRVVVSGLNPWGWTIKVRVMDRGVKGYSSVSPWLQIHLGVNIPAKSAIASCYTLLQ